MANISVFFSDGSSHTYDEVPDDVSREDAIARAKKDFPDKQISDIEKLGTAAQKRPSINYENMPASEVATRALINLPQSAVQYGKGIVEAVTSPIQTARNIVDIGAGALQNMLPESLVQAIGEEPVSRQKASQVGEFYKQRYGSIPGFKQAISTDPVGVLADVATVATGGAMAASKSPQVSSVLSNVAKFTEPTSLAVQGVRALGKGAEKVVTPSIGVKTGVGTVPLRQAYESGKEGGEAAKSFRENITGQVPFENVLSDMRSNLDSLGKQRMAAYKANMQRIKADTTVLNFNGIDSALNQGQNVVSYKGQVKAPSAAAKLDEVRQIVDDWKNLDPVDFHTPEGLDALKQRVGDVLESIPFENKTARKVVGDVYTSIKSEISKQAPTYAKTMQAYWEATELMKEAEKALSLGKKASADTAMRKLQSLMRDNVNTNWGQRRKTAEALQQAGGKNVMPALAGQALSDASPRGVQRATSGISPFVTGGAGFQMTGDPLLGGLIAGADIAASSPRLMGEAYYGAGRARGLLDDMTNALPVEYYTIPNLMFQSQQPKE